MLSTILLVLAIGSSLAAQGITTPKQQFGFNIGDDYQLATYEVEYWHKLDKESERMRVVEIGKTAEGRPQLMAIITSPENFKKLDRYIPVEKYYVPGSILRVAVDNTAPIAHGVDDHVDVFFDNSPVFSLDPEAMRKGVRPVAWFDTPAPLRSGWAFGQGYLNDGVEIVQAAVGKGNLFMFAPEITFRAQPHGTFKFLFNGLYLSAATPPSGGANSTQGSR